MSIGEVAERFNAPALKAGGPLCPGGSNPSLSSIDWMVGRVDYCIRLESGSPPNTGTGGSNPSPSAEVL